MNTSAAGSTVRVGNHAVSAEEQAAGAPDRLPYVDDAGAPVDPDAVTIWLAAPTGQVRRFRYPTVDVGDQGLVQQESAGRFYVDWTPLAPEDGLWTWASLGEMSGSSVGDQDAFYVKRPIAGP